MMFIDCEVAYDSVNQKHMVSEPEKFKIFDKLLKLIIMTLHQTINAVIERDETKDYDVLKF